MGKKIVAISLALVMVLSFTACGGEQLPSAQEIVDGTTQALDDIRTYEFEIDMTMGMSSEAEGETFEMTMGTDTSGELDLDNQQMRMGMAINMALPGEDEVDAEVEAYLIDNTGYLMTKESGEEPVWEKEEVSETDWEQTVEMLTMTEPQLELLQAAHVEVIGSEKVKGVDCYVLRVTPDMGQLWETAMHQATLGFAEEMALPEFTEEILDEAICIFSVKHWVAKDTYFLMKVEIDMAIEFNAEAMGVAEGEMSIDSAMTMLIYNYNQPISIELPPEAEEAVGY